MDVASKLLKQIAKVHARLAHWIQYHEFMFDHSKYRPERTEEEIEEWKAYYNEMMES